MTYLTTITKKGQMTMPKKVRKILGIKIPSQVELEIDKKTKQLQIRRAPDIMDFAGRFKVEKPINAIKVRGLMEKNYERA